MSRAVLWSIHPEWCQKIVTWEKLLEVRKTIPRLAPPFKNYIYCTRAKAPFALNADFGSIRTRGGVVIGEFVCPAVIDLRGLLNAPWPTMKGDGAVFLQGMVTKWAGLSEEEFKTYGGRYGVRISQLLIYRKPKPLGDFRYSSSGETLTRPPQSWCYVEPIK